jgi:DnaD/phage-associated family protein
MKTEGYMAESLVRALLKDRPIAYRPILARTLGGVTVGLWVSQLIYWSDKGRDPDGWIYKTYNEWEEETAMSRRELDGARKRAGLLGVVEEKLAQIPARLHYRINWDRLEELLNAQNVRSSLYETANPVCTKRTNKIVQNVDTITESTTENTTDSSSATKQKPQPLAENKAAIDPIVGEVYTAWENTAGLLSPAQVDLLGAMIDDYRADNVRDAINEAAESTTRISPRYVEAILQRWKREGKKGKPAATAPAYERAIDGSVIMPSGGGIGGK